MGRRTSTGSSSSREGGPSAVPSDPSAIRAALDALGLTPRRGLGQSFLADPFTADAVAALVDVPRGAAVLEIGGGLGLLTEALLRRGLGPLTVVEKDPRLAEHLARAFEGRARVLRGDALGLELPEAEAAVGNLPYAVATPIVRRLLDLRVPRIVAMLQREVAERLAAGPGSRSYGRLSILTRALADVELFRTVPASSFVPAPAVESRIVVLTRAGGPPRVPSRPALERVLDPIFASRRKQLGNLLPRLGPRGPEMARSAGWPEGWERRRPEELPPEAYFRLAEEVARRRRDRPTA